MKWFGLRVTRGGWRVPSIVMVGGTSRQIAEEMLGEAGYMTLPGKLDVLPLVNGSKVKMVLLGAPSNPPVNPFKALNAYRCSSQGCGNTLPEEYVLKGYKLCAECYEKSIEPTQEGEWVPVKTGTRCVKCAEPLSTLMIFSGKVVCSSCAISFIKRGNENAEKCRAHGVAACSR